MTDPSLSMKTSLQLYRRLLRYAFHYYGFFIISIIGFALFAFMQAQLVLLMEDFLEALKTKSREQMIAVPLTVVTYSVLRGIGHYLGAFYIARVGLGVVNDLRKQLFAHIVYLPCGYYDRYNSGELVSLIIYNIQQVTGSVTNAIKILLRDGFTLIAFLGTLFFLNWRLTLVAIVAAPILAGLVYLASRYFRRASRRIQKTMGMISHVANETFQGFRLVKSFGGQKHEIKRFSQASDKNTAYATKFERAAAAQTPILHIVIAIDLAVILFLVIYFWEGSTGSAVAYVSAAGLIAKPFRQLSTLNTIIQKGLAAAETIFATLDEQQELDCGSKTLSKVKGLIEFKNVSYSYTESKQALNHINFTIQPGETVALVGRSGSGKTTIANMLLRFYDPQSGIITLDGTPIQEFTLESLRAQVALVNQQTVLFNDSVLANIAYGYDDNQLQSEQIKGSAITAAENAYAKHFIEEMSEGFDTLVGEDGTRMSGGQRQRLAVARALFKDAPILVLDEATSALDNESEKQIQLALEKLKKNRTTLVIAHRLSTIENADKILVLDQGQIVEAGNHTELLAKQGYYASLHAQDFEES